MSVYKTEGIVLHQFELGEADRILTLYTRDRGKVRAVAKGVRRTRSGLAGSTQLFTYVDLVLYQGKDLDSISQVQLKESFNKLREDLFRMAYSSYVLDLVRELTVEGDANEGMFVLLLQTLRLMAEVDDLEMILRIFEIRAMTLMGYQPVLDRCLHCNEVILSGKVLFHPGSGGLLCGECSNALPGKTVLITRGTVEIMKRFLDLNYRQLLKLKLTDYARKELELVMEPFIQYHVDRNLKSLDFLKSVRTLEQPKQP